MFIDTHKGKVNLAYVKRIEQRQRIRRNGSREDYLVAVDVDDVQCQLYTSEERALETSLMSVTVPASEPMTLVCVWYFDPKMNEPGPEFEIERYPIVAWRVPNWGGWPTPVAIGCPEDMDASYVIELPSGKFQEVGFEGTLHATLEAVKDYVRSKKVR